MGLVYRAKLNPGKLELLNTWLAHQPWAQATDTEFERIDSYRFDDPAGEVGIEVFLVRAGDGPVLHVPVTYRGAPLSGAEPSLIGTMDHSVLGTRYVYDGLADPVAVTAFIDAIMTGGKQAVVYAMSGDERVVLDQTAHVIGSGVAEQGITPRTAHGLEHETNSGVATVKLPAEVGAGATEQRDVVLALRRNLEASDSVVPDPMPALNLTGSWAKQLTPVVLAWIPEEA